MKRAGWKRLTPPGQKLFATWRHESGWVVTHCGHPTAIFPYAVIDPEYPDHLLCTPRGTGFMTLKSAFNAVEAIRSGLCKVGDGPSAKHPPVKRRFIEENWICKIRHHSRH